MARRIKKWLTAGLVLTITMLVTGPVYAGPAVGALAAGALAAASFTGPVTVLGLTFTSAIGFGAFVAGATLALGLVQRALTPKPKTPELPDFSRQSQNRTLSFRQAITAWEIAYGEVYKGGPITFVESTNNNRYLHIIVTLASHPCEEVAAIFLDDYPIYPDTLDNDGDVVSGRFRNQVRIVTDLGTTGSQPFSSLESDSPSWTSAHRQEERTKIYLRLRHNRNTFPTGLPNIKVRLKGKKVLDTRTSTTYWTPNPGLCIRDYMVTSDNDGGLGVASGEIDTTTLDATANTCEEFVTTKSVSHEVSSVDTTDDYLDLAGDNGDVLKFFTGDRVQVTTTGTLPTGISAATNYYVIVKHELASKDDNLRIQLASSYDNALSSTAISLSSSGSGTHTVTKNAEPRYTLNGTIDTEEAPNSILDDLRTSMAGRVVPIGGSWLIKAGAWTTPTLTFDEDDMVGSLDVRSIHTRRERFNAVKGVYSSQLTVGQPTDYPPITSTAYESEDNGDRIYRDVDLPYTNRPATAQRIAKIELERHRRQITAGVKLNLSGLQLQATDTLNLDNDRFGWSGKSFEIATFRLSPEGDPPALTVRMDLREADSSIYTFTSSADESTAGPPPKSGLPDPFDVIEPTGLTLDSGSDVLDIRQDGTIFSRIKVTWTESIDDFAEEIEIQFKKSTDSAWNTGPSVPVGTEQAFILDVKDGVGYDVRIRAVNAIGAVSDWVEELGHTVLGKSEPPSDLDQFTVSRLADGTRRFEWVHDSPEADVKAGGGYRIKYEIGASFDWDTANELHTGLLQTSPFETNQLAANTYTFGIKAVDSTGNESTTALTITATLGDPRLREVLLQRIETEEGWDGTITNGYKTENNTLEANASETWADMSSSWDSLSTSWRYIVGSTSPLIYETAEMDLGSDVVFTPLVTVTGMDTVTLTMKSALSTAGGVSTGSTGYSTLEQDTARYVKIKASMASTAAPYISQMVTLLDGESVIDEFNDVATSATTASWFESVQAGEFRVQHRKNVASITSAQIVALQSVSGGWSWSLESKSTNITGSTSPAARFKIYDSNSSLADALVDVELKGPKSS